METFKIEVNGKEILVKENGTILNASIRQQVTFLLAVKAAHVGCARL